MPGITPVYGSGPLTYTVVSTGSVTGGQIVEARSDGTVQAAAAGSAVALGVALQDGVGTAAPSGTTGYGSPVYDVSYPGNIVAVAREGVYKLTAAAATTFGALLKTAANGQVTPWLGTDAANLIIGRCVDANGIAAGGTGLVALDFN